MIAVRVIADQVIADQVIGERGAVPDVDPIGAMDRARLGRAQRHPRPQHPGNDKATDGMRHGRISRAPKVIAPKVIAPKVIALMANACVVIVRSRPNVPTARVRAPMVRVRRGKAPMRSAKTIGRHDRRDGMISAMNGRLLASRAPSYLAPNRCVGISRGRIVRTSSSHPRSPMRRAARCGSMASTLLRRHWPIRPAGCAACC